MPGEGGGRGGASAAAVHTGKIMGSGRERNQMIFQICSSLQLSNMWVWRSCPPKKLSWGNETNQKGGWVHMHMNSPQKRNNGLSTSEQGGGDPFKRGNPEASHSLTPNRVTQWVGPVLGPESPYWGTRRAPAFHPALCLGGGVTRTTLLKRRCTYAGVSITAGKGNCYRVGR